MEQPINQRIKFLLDTLKLSAREFSRAVGVADNNTQNYIAPRFAQPKADYLEKVLHHFESINPIWLLTGRGEPFLTPPTESEQPKTNAKIFLHSPVVGKNSGIANQQQTSTTSSELATAYALIDQLKSQLQDKERIIKLLEKNIPST